MENELPKAYEPALIEEKWATFWVDQKIFAVPTPASTPSTAPFVELLPPPNVTGRLHIGHMLEHTQMDILARWHRMCGRTSLWVPGTDHAGIATQMMVERQLATEGKKRTDFSREAFTERVWAWKQEYGSAITDQMKRLGASVDWSREYFTMDDRLSVAVREAFVRLYEQGLIYRGAYIVNWDPQLQSAVSDLEVDSEERAGHLYHIRYDLSDGPLPDGTASITIATTRPETMLGDTAVAVNPTDERYLALIGKTLTLPLSGSTASAFREIPIVADDWANPEFGTGAVKVTPAHDPNDFAIGQRHNLPSPSIMDTQARIDLPGSPYHGLDRFEARKRIVADLETSGHLVKIADHTLTLPISQRTGAVIEPRLSMQWFLAVNKEPKGGGESIAARALAAVTEGHIHFTPDNNRKTYVEWMTNLHDWCLSRQLWWGHRIPAWHCNACQCITVSRTAVDACSGCGITDIRQETDVLDTWFSSGLLPFSVFGWPAEIGSSKQEIGSSKSSLLPTSYSLFPASLTPDLAAFYPTTQLVTGFDILFFWVARMIMLSCHLMADVRNADGSARTLKDTVPFREVYIHALVRDADRQKISKTKGNVIDPIEIVTKYGTDAVRFTLAAQASPGTDIAFNEARTEGYRAFANKIWNAARFLQMNLDRAKEAGYTVTLDGLAAGFSPLNKAAESEGFSPGPTTIAPTSSVILSEGPERAKQAEGTQSKDPEGLHPTTTAPPFSTTAPLETRWILSRLSTVAAEVAHALDTYRFDEAAQLIYQFFWGEFCDWYLELIKLRLNFPLTATELSSRPEAAHSAAEAERHTADPAQSGTPRLQPRVSSGNKKEEGVLTPGPATQLTLNALVTTFDAALRLLSPFMPFLTEELWHALYLTLGQPAPAKSIALARYPQAADFPADPTAVAQITTLQELIVTIRGLRKEMAVPEKDFSPIQIFATSGDAATLASANADMLAKQARVASVEIATAPLTGNNTRSTATFDVAVIYERQIDIPAERERLTKDLAKFNKGIEAADKQLNNEGFTARAPAAIIEGLRKQHAETTALKQKTEAALAALPNA